MAPHMYEIEINRQTCTLERLALAGDPGGINLAHRSTLTAFGAVAYTRRDTEAKMAPSGPPGNVEAVDLEEHRAYAQVVEESADRLVGRNPSTGHTVTWDLGADGFDLWLEGDLPFADQAGLDLDVAFMDVNQDAPEDYQYTVQCPYASEDRSVCYVYLSRPTPPGMLIVALTPALWRLRYGRGGFGEVGWIPWAYSAPLHAVLGLQMLHRVDSALDPANRPGPVRQGVRVRFPHDIHEARRYMADEMGLPILSAPTLGGEPGDPLPFAVRGPATSAELVGPDGQTTPLALRPGDDRTRIGEAVLPGEGFYTVRAGDGKGRTSDLTLRCGAPWLQALRRSVVDKPPHAAFSSEGMFWADAMAMARRAGGPHEHLDRCLYDLLVRIFMQGLDEADLPRLPAPAPTDLVEKARKRDGWFVGAPVPVAHTGEVRDFSPFHAYMRDRAQDTSSFVELMLLAEEAYGDDAFYEHAIRMTDAFVRDNIDDEGRIYIVSRYDPDTRRDYTTVLAPLQHFVQLLRAMEARGDARAAGLRATVLRTADYLVARGMDFPTEGHQPHVRWTEDGSISCTALTLLYVYRHVEPKPAYLEMARRVLAFHESWGMDAPDVRMHGSSFRYWETQWENDQEGRAINAGHPWTLWRAEALYHDAWVARDPRRLLQSWNGYWTNRAKFMPDGATYSCFTPDYIPDRPRRFALVHSYPEAVDPSISYYLWPRARETWFRTGAVLDSAAAGCDADCGVVALNGRLEERDGERVFTPHAPAFDILFLLGQDGAPVRIATDRPVTVLADGPLDIATGRPTASSDLHGVTVEPDGGVIRVARA